MKIQTTIWFLLAILVVTTTAAAQDATPSPESVRISVQQICPVSGQKLGDQGPPIKAKVGEEEVFLCCNACLKGEVQPDHWQTIHQNMVGAQRICTVMENDLPKKPKWAIVNGRMFFVCCPPCIDDIKADPEKFTKKLDALYAESLKRAGQ